MITGDIKQKVDAVWQTFWNKGFTNTSAIFEQITYLLFMKMLDDKQLEKEAIANLIGDLLLNPTFPDGMWHNPTTDQDVPYNEMRWHVFKEMDPTKMLNRVRNDVFIFLRYVGKEGSAYSKAMEDTVFQITDARFLSRVIEGIDEISSDGADMMGDGFLECGKLRRRAGFPEWRAGWSRPGRSRRAARPGQSAGQGTFRPAAWIPRR